MPVHPRLRPDRPKSPWRGPRGHPLGTVYLLHYAEPLWEIRHYIGWTRNLRHRIWQHANGFGSITTYGFYRHDIPFAIARLWHDSSDVLEQQLIHAGADRYCPICGYQGAQSRAMYGSWETGRAELEALGLDPEWRP